MENNENTAYDSFNIVLGTVVSIDTQSFTCEVMFDNGISVPNIGIMNLTGGPLSTDINPIPNLRGARVAVIEIMGNSYVLGTLPVTSGITQQVSVSPTPETGTGSANEKTYGKNTPTFCFDKSQGRTTEWQGGDKIMSADGGSELLLGAEGLAVLKASPLAQIILGAFKDFCHIVAREFAIYTDFGQIEFTGGGKSGCTGMSIKGGSTFCTESSSNDAMWTTKVQLGSVAGDPTCRYSIAINDTTLSEHIRISGGVDGCYNSNFSKDQITYVGQDYENIVARNYRISVGKTITDDAAMAGLSSSFSAAGDVDWYGDQTRPADKQKAESGKVGDLDGIIERNRNWTVKKDDNLTVKCNRYCEVQINDTEYVKGNKVETVDGNRTATTKGNGTDTVQGSKEEAITGTKTLKTNFLNILTNGLSLSGNGGSGGSFQLKVPSLNIVQG